MFISSCDGVSVLIFVTSSHKLDKLQCRHEKKQYQVTRLVIETDEGAKIKQRRRALTYKSRINNDDETSDHQFANLIAQGQGI
jgi:hypothetical protein